MALKFCIVDDDEVVLRLIGVLLERRGHQVTLFHAGTSAVLDIPDEQPDCVITDLIMIGLDGYQLIEELASELTDQTTTFIVVSSKSDEKTVARILGLGAAGLIAKPIEPKTFADQVEQILAKY